MADEELKKKIINVPNLPNIVQGDGRYLMTLLNNFLKSMATQVNFANGFSAEEINPEKFMETARLIRTELYGEG